MLSAHGGMSFSLVQPLSQPAFSDPGGLIAEGPLIVVSAPALSAGRQLVCPGVVLLVSGRASACGQLLLATHEWTGGHVLLILVWCCLTELCFCLLWTCRTARDCLTVLPCRLVQSPLDYQKTVPGFVRSTPTPPPTPPGLSIARRTMPLRLGRLHVPQLQSCRLPKPRLMLPLWPWWSRTVSSGPPVFRMPFMSSTPIRLVTDSFPAEPVYCRLLF